MNCKDLHDNIYLLLSGEASDEERTAMEQHLSTCRSCAEEYRLSAEALKAVTPHQAPQPSCDLTQRILAAVDERRQQPRRPNLFRRSLFRITAATTALAAVVILAVMIGNPGPVQAAKNCFRNAITAMEGVQTLTMEFGVRTEPQENFSYINPELEFVSHKLTVLYGATPLWRMEKQGGRTVVNDGQRQAMWNANLQEGWIHDPTTCVIEELSILVDPRLLMLREKDYASENKNVKYDVTRTEEQIHLVVTAPAQGDFTQSNYGLNTSISETNNRRDYTFDRHNGRLLSAKVTAIIDGRERTILETTRIAYDLPVDQVALTALPTEKITWHDLTRPIGTSRFAEMTAKQAAEIMLHAMTGWDTAVLGDAMPYYLLDEMREAYKGIIPVTIGEPVKSGTYAGVFVPCKFARPDGSTDKIMLALRNDNPTHSWVIDGGL